MNDAKRRFFSGDSLQQALVQAANYFNLDPSYVAYKSLEKRHGFLKTRRKVVIEVDPDNPRRESPAPLPPAERTVPPPPPSSYLTRDSALPSSEPNEAPPPAPAEQPPRRERERPERAERRGRDRGGDRDRGPREGDRDRPRRNRGDDAPRRPRRSPVGMGEARQPAAPAVAGEEGLVTLPEKPRGISERYPPAAGAIAEAAANSAKLLLRLAGLDLDARVFQGEERLEVELVGDDVDWCFADDGEFLNAVEHLLPRMIRTLSGEPAVVRVDCDNFHEIREERLRSLAQRIAEDVRRKGRPRVLEPMNPADRRIIHTTLTDDPGVVTESEGDGYFKRVMIRPV